MKHFSSFDDTIIFKVPNNIRLNSTHYLTMKLSSKRELHQIAIKRSSDNDFADFKKIYKKHTAE